MIKIFPFLVLFLATQKHTLLWSVFNLQSYALLWEGTKRYTSSFLQALLSKTSTPHRSAWWCFWLGEKRRRNQARRRRTRIIHPSFFFSPARTLSLCVSYPSLNHHHHHHRVFCRVPLGVCNQSRDIPTPTKRAQKKSAAFGLRGRRKEERRRVVCGVRRRRRRRRCTRTDATRCEGDLVSKVVV